MIAGAVATWSMADSATNDLLQTMLQTDKQEKEMENIAFTSHDESNRQLEQMHRQMAHSDNTHLALLDIGKSFAAMLFCYIGFTLSLLYRLFGVLVERKH